MSKSFIVGAVAVLALMSAAGCEGDGVAHAHPVPAPNAHVRDVAEYPRLLCRADVADPTRSDDRWLADGVELQRVRVEQADGEPVDDFMEVVATQGGGVRVFPADPAPIGRSDRATLHIRAKDASPKAPVVFELAFFDTIAANRYWRTIELDDTEWHELDIELPYLRYDRGLVPRWERVTSWGLVFETEGAAEIRGIDLWQDEPEASPYLGEDELRKAFAEPTQVRVADRAPFVVLTDEPRVDLERVLDALVDMDRRTRRRLPDMATPDRPVPLLIFAEERGYRDFWRRFSERTSGGARPRRGDEGYTWMGIATAWYNESYGAVRPTYVHEASHALLERSLGLAAQRSWLFEGMGVFDQLDVSRQDLSDVYRQGIRRSDVKMPLHELLSGQPIPTTRYWQATLFLEWLLVDPERTRALASAVGQMQRSGSTDLIALVPEHFAQDLPTLNTSFWAWAADTYDR